jgi:LuxR family maltose regulon positive regulatory protein
MTESITSPQLDAIVPPLRANVPFVPDWVIRRPRIEDRLDLGMSGLLTAVTAPTGSGKTTAVAVWAEHARLSGGVAWLNVSDVGAEPNSFWPALRCVLIDAGMQDLLPVPGSRSSEQSRYLLLGALGTALHATGPWVVVLDDYPTGPSGRLERELGIVLDRARRGVRLVVMSQSE